jgi:HD-GYP domain-containing protein (c-di-GMP phosphodiesterase class II)
VFDSLLHPSDEGHCQRLASGGFLHDIGKVGIPNAVLLKPDRLTADEFALWVAQVAS